MIQRKRLQLFFDYEHRFEAYVPREKRVFGYFALPVLVGDEIVAAHRPQDRSRAGKLLMQQWTWVGEGSPRRHKKRIEEALHRSSASSTRGEKRRERLALCGAPGRLRAVSRGFFHAMCKGNNPSVTLKTSDQVLGTVRLIS